jgi:Asp-tRNA(Asn)/Glu-tRNA(Gln) amidotransferase A subunit family amidase
MKLLPLVGTRATKVFEELMKEIDEARAEGRLEVTEGLFDLHIVIKDNCKTASGL